MAKRALMVSVFIFFLAATMAISIDVKDTKLLNQATISKDHVAFIYAEDLWVTKTDGSNVRRLTTVRGPEMEPVFSPDGKWIAFSAQYDGNVDVFVVPVDGGVPKRLTWHPGPDIVRDFTPDSSAVLFISQREVFTNRYFQLFTVTINGGFPEKLPIPNAFRAKYSPDGQKIAYTPIIEAFQQWKRYRGGRVSVIWIYTKSDHSVVKIPQPEGRCNDTDPMWIGNRVYFRSDRNGEFNLFSFDPSSKEITPLTQYTQFHVDKASAGNGKIIYDQGGHLHIFDPQTAQSTKLTIGIASDLLEVRPRYVKGIQNVRNGTLSPTGSRIVLEFRGDVVTFPAEKGDPRNLTSTASVMERYPSWSPDGKSIAYVSEQSGEYELYIQNQDGKGDIKKYELEGNGFYENLVWAPDSQKIVYADNSMSLYWIDLKTGDVKKIVSEYLYMPSGLKMVRGQWSPDSKWIAYSINTEANIGRVHLYSLEQGKSFPITDGLSDATEPVFDKSGKYLYFFASTDAGPNKHWFDQSNIDMQTTRSIYLAVLRSDITSPLAKESDEETIKEETPSETEKETAKDKENKYKKEESFSVDFEGIDFRILALPVPPGSYSSLQAGEDGKVYYLETQPGFMSRFQPISNLHVFDLAKKKDEVLGSGISNYMLSGDKKKMTFSAQQSIFIVPTGKIQPGKGRINIDAFELLIKPRAEWKQMLRETWRINRDYFYDPHMHGADWDAVWTKYEVFLPHLACRSDLNRLISWMLSELAVGHSYSGGGDFRDRPKRVPGGLLGADYAIENGRFRIKKIFGGLNWNPQLRSPLTEPGVNINEGDYLIAVNGSELKPPENIYSFFENTAEKIVEVTVSSSPDGLSPRTASVVPVANEYALRNRDWVEGNIKKVNAATNGRVAYVYVPNTALMGHVYFKRYFFPQSNKDAIIVDERFNGGGMLADYYIDILRRPLIAHWAMRYGADLKTPSASIQGPKVMIIDETAGSGGDLLPWMFRKFKLGPLVGKRTWGGLVGVLGFPTLMDGGFITAPNFAIWTEDGWVVENEGVPPDIEVEQWPADVIAGKDPQLDKAIAIVMGELKKNPPKKWKRPPYPKR
ncbi:PDZ domain-containing protein [Acidobacteriota bacterium]